MVKFELVVPAYNEEKNIQLIVNRFIQAAITQGFLENECRLVIVNNGSTDNSKIEFAKIINDSSKSKWVKIVDVDRNQGYGYGLLQGLLQTESEIIGYSHADMQCDPADAFKGYKILKSSQFPQKIIIKGVRFNRNYKDIFVSRVFETLASFRLGFKFYEINAQPKVFHKNLLALIKNPPKDFSFDLYVLFMALKANYKIQTIEVSFPARIHGTSKWATHFLSRNRTIINMIKYIWRLKKQQENPHDN